MPIQNGKYVNPGWQNGGPPAIDANELNAISDTLENLDENPGTTYTPGNGISIAGQTISAKISSNDNNSATFGTDGGIYVPTPSYSLPPATTDSLGGVIIGSGISVQPNGTISVTGGGGSGKSYARIVVGTSQNGWTASDCDYLCTGTSDQSIFNTAINNLPTTGGEIIILDGTYNFSAPLNIQKGNVVLKGNGNSTIFKRQFNASSYYPDTSLGILGIFGDNCAVSFILIDGNKSQFSSENNSGIVVSNADSCVIQCCAILNVSGNGIYTNQTCKGTTVSSCFISNCNSGVLVGGAGCTGQIISNSFISQCDIGCVAGGETTLTGNSLKNNTTVGIEFNITSNCGCASGNYISSPSSAVGINIQSQSISVCGNVVVGSTSANVQISAAGTNSLVSSNVLNDLSGINVPVKIIVGAGPTKNGNNIIMGNIFGGVSVTSPDSTDLIINNK